MSNPESRRADGAAAEPAAADRAAATSSGSSGDVRDSERLDLLKRADRAAASRVGGGELDGADVSLRANGSEGAGGAVSIAIAVVRDGERFLVGVRGAGAVLAGKSEFPGGKVEPGETPAAAAVRECREETGLEVEVEFEYPSREEAYEHGRVALRFFACRLRASGEAVPGGGYRWVDRSELAGLDFPRGNRALVRLLTDVRSAGDRSVGGGATSDGSGGRAGE